jgi:SAM-dependent methyltransferase
MQARPDANIPPHELDWTADRIRAFWDYYSANEALDDSYFSKQAGRSLLAYVSRKVRIGTAVDIGCGCGDLIGYLLDRGIQARGADQSPASVARVNARFAESPSFRGAVVGTGALPDGTADTAFILEVVEHLDDATLDSILREAHRVLRPGGQLVVTTPNQENLGARKVYCPDCGAVFHRMQHVRAWSAESLSARVGTHGFECLSAEAIALSPFAGWRDLAWRVAYPLFMKKRPNLIYIGKKGAE